MYPTLPTQQINYYNMLTNNSSNFVTKKGQKSVYFVTKKGQKFNIFNIFQINAYFQIPIQYFQYFQLQIFSNKFNFFLSFRPRMNRSGEHFLGPASRIDFFFLFVCC